jgi:hypothetical protein
MSTETKLHRVLLEFEAGYGPTLKLIHPDGACEPATACSECGRKLTDPATPPCEVCPEPSGECWLADWVDNLTAEEMLAGPVEFAVVPECDGETLTLHVAAEQEPTDAN